jgi:hypothetical protein
MTPFQTDFDLAVEFAQKRAEAETEMVAAVLADSARAVPLAEAEGVVFHCFSHPDLRLVYLAADVLRDSPVLDVLVLARRALKAEGYWCADGPISFGMRWSNETLSALAFHVPFHADATVMLARWLVDLDHRERAARVAFDSFIFSLKGRAA